MIYYKRIKNKNDLEKVERVLKMKTIEEIRKEAIKVILERADNMGLLVFDRFSLLMDLNNTEEDLQLDMVRLSNSKDETFTHDIIGIQRSINRQTKKVDITFLPICNKKAVA